MKIVSEASEPAGEGITGRPSCRTRSYLEVLVDQGRIDVNELYSEGMAGRLAQALKKFGLEARQRFASPCG